MTCYWSDKTIELAALLENNATKFFLWVVVEEDDWPTIDIAVKSLGSITYYPIVLIIFFYLVLWETCSVSCLHVYYFGDFVS